MLVRSIWIDGEVSLRHYLAVAGDSRQAGLLLRSLGIAVATAALAVVLGTGQAFLLARTTIRGAKLWRNLYLLPLCIPPHIHAIAWIYLCGETGALNHALFDIYTPLGAAVILALSYHPLVTLMVHSALRSTDQRLEEAARQYHRPLRVLGFISLPLLMPHILAGAVFVFIFAFFNYGVPALLRVHTYPVEIFAQFSAFYNEAAATALAVPVIIVALLLLALQRFWMRGRSYAVMQTGQVKAAPLSLGKLRRPALVYMIALLTAAVGLPLATLAVQTKSPAVFGAVWRSAGRQIIFTTVLSLAAATAITALAYLLAGTQWKRTARPGIWRDILFFAPLALPATVLGIGLIYLWNRPATQIIYTGAGILVIAYAGRFAPFSLQAVLSGLGQVGPSLREAAWLYQGSWWKRTLAVDLPLCLPSLVAGWSIAFILCMGELGATLLVVPPGMGTIALKIYNLMHYGANQMVAALSLVLIVINLLVAAGAVAGLRLGKGKRDDKP
jgi:iron(III) transport system permease protein